MPELPEVETIKRDLNKTVTDKKIIDVCILGEKQVTSDHNLFIKNTLNSKITKVKRRAKMLIFDLDNGYHLISHLKMTGQWIFVGQNKIAGGGHPIHHDFRNLPDKSSRAIFVFDDNSKLFFNDTRGFGWVKLVNDDELKKAKMSYGPEPLTDDFNFEIFYQSIKNKNVPIKPLLLDQKVIAGIGNIYASEVCFCARIDPRRKAKDLSKNEIRKLYNCILKILALAIEKRGTSSRDYVDAFGRQGSMNDFLKIYQKTGERCCRKGCDGVIKKIVQRQRSTFYCSDCQK